MKSQPHLHTARLILRPLVGSDAKQVQLLAGDEKIAATTGVIPHPYPDGMAEAWIAKHPEKFDSDKEVNFAIELKESGELIGCISLIIARAHEKAELGYWVGVPYWNQGYATEAAKEMVRYGFADLHLNKILARYIITNESSGKVLKSAGFKEEGLFRNDAKKNGVFVDIVYCGILKKDIKKA